MALFGGDSKSTVAPDTLSSNASGVGSPYNLNLEVRGKNLHPTIDLTDHNAVATAQALTLQVLSLEKSLADPPAVRAFQNTLIVLALGAAGLYIVGRIWK